MDSTTAELAWLTFLPQDLRIPLSNTLILHCDNLSAPHMSVNLVFHGKTKHIELDVHYVHEQIALGALKTQFVPSSLQLADIFTKPFAKIPFCMI